MFDTLLIANRGEIACRIIRSARAMGLRTVAVHSEADAEALHVKLADDAHCIGPAAASESYLNIPAILAAAKASGSGAIHPGYGFLSENADFARAGMNAGLVFVGPPPEAIEIMGDKAIAKAHMIDADVPCIPGYQGKDQSDETLLREAQAIGTPLMVKAAAGGGGKGMRLVTDLTDLPDAISLARAEALAAFGSDALILERALPNARHIEIQIFADSHGNLIHLGERECSIQRRHQKIIEESPCPFITETIRKRMFEAAMNAARAVDYNGAGTVEFLLDQAGENFYFLEMNTRLQVEHPVTEEVTGLDLVALQLAVAQGQPLPITQADVTFTGHAIEARLYAEDPKNGFLPSIGKIHEFKMDSSIRTDTGVQSGNIVSPHYDPMLAKLIAHGNTRADALSKLRHALGNTAVLGLDTNIHFLRHLLDHPTVTNGTVTTTFLDHAYRDGPTDAALTSETIALAAFLLLRSEMSVAHAASLLTDDTLNGFVSDGGLPIPVDLSLNGAAFCVTATGVGSPQVTLSDGTWTHVVSDDLRVDGRRVFAHHTEASAGGVFLQTETHHLHICRACPWETSDTDTDDTLTAPMPGLLTALHVQVGDTVTKGDTLAVLEAMKLQHHLTAPDTGTVTHIHTTSGAQLAKDAPILTLETSP